MIHNRKNLINNVPLKVQLCGASPFSVGFFSEINEKSSKNHDLCTPPFKGLISSRKNSAVGMICLHNNRSD